MGDMAAAAPFATAGASGPRRMRRALEVPALSDLRGPGDGILDVPRALSWSGDEQAGLVNLRDEDAAGLAYEAIIETARSTADLVKNLNADLLARLWPTLGMSPPRRRAWESKNPSLAAAA